jgi:hypothetical protein
LKTRGFLVPGQVVRSMGGTHHTALLEIEEALGPGIEIALEPGGGRVRAVGARRGGLWLGLDRASLVDSDGGSGTPMAAVVALPASTFAGCRLEADLLGGFVDGPRTVLVASYGIGAVPSGPLLRTVARVAPGARWVDEQAANRIAHEARARYRARRSEVRVLGGRAWRAPAGLDVDTRRFVTPHSRAEYALERLPPRFVRGLEGLLDDDERVIYAVGRPPAAGGSLVERARQTRDRRAALLLLTDRQLIWMIDHVPPDRYLLDWGVDARLVALEALSGVTLRPPHRRLVEIEIATRGGTTRFELPAELIDEAEVMSDLLRRFVPEESRLLPVRRYVLAAIPFDIEPASRFGQASEASELVAALEESVAPEPVLAAFYSPRRERVREVAAAVVTSSRLAVSRDQERRALRLEDLADISLALSPLVGRLELHGSAVGRASRPAGFTYPAPLAQWATPFIRLLRRAWANAAAASPWAVETEASRG